MSKKTGKLVLLTIIAAAVLAFFAFDLGNYLSFSYIKSRQVEFQSFYKHNSVLMIFAFMSVYIIVSALSIPGATVLSLLAGALFGLVKGVIIVSFASSIGATLAFVAARFILKDWVQQKFARNLKALNEGIQREGAFYLFTLRLIPAVPFFVINLVMALTPIKTFTFYWVSQAGMFLGTVVYINAGTQLGRLESPQGILPPSLILSFVLLGVFPFVIKKAFPYFKDRFELGKPKKPTKPAGE